MTILAIKALDGGISTTNARSLYIQHPPLAHTHPSNMTVVSNDPSLWSIINLNIFSSYWFVAAGVVVVYDWVLTLGQEIELFWRQRWSLMTVLYLVTRYIGIPYSVAAALLYMPSVSLTGAVSDIVNYAINGTNLVVLAMLGVIMSARLHAMYQRSRIMLIFIAIIFLAVYITCGVITAITLKHATAEELILSGTYFCEYVYGGDDPLLISIAWVLIAVWEVFALCLSVWISVRHFRDLRQLGPSTGSTIGDCFGVLIKFHVLYFSLEAQILQDVIQILFIVQIFMLGPRLILSVREYHAKLVAESDAETSMNSIVFQEHVHVLTSSTV
ncbi:hypothetical protein BDR03DRAFT_510391 [Suillus americanus]|nr:hypothetical protein BDR03DRAFT_510391 [Suillus americanus]